MPMQNPFMAMRQRNILAPQFGQQGPSQPRLSFNFRQPEPMDEQPHVRTFDDDINDLMTNVGPGVQAYRDYLTRLPQREDYKPSVWTRIAAGLSGAAAGMRDPGEGIRVAQDLNSSRFSNALHDYANEGVGLKARADMEQDELDSNLKMLQNARAMGLKYDEFELKRLTAENEMKNKTTTANAAMTRAQAYAAAQAKPGYDASPQQDGSVLYINKNDPTKTVRVPASTVQAGQLGVAWRNAATAERNAGTNSRMANIAAQNAQTNVQRANSYDYSVRNPRPTAQRPASPRVQQDAEDNALRQMMTDPLFKDFIQVGKDGFLSVVEDDGSEDYQDFLTALDAKTQEILKGGSMRGRGGR